MSNPFEKETKDLFICLRKIVKNNAWVISFFILLIIFRLSLTGKGHRFDIDEDRYLNALYFWIEFFRGSFTNAIAYLFNALGRPGFVIVSLIPAGVQILLAHFKLITATSLHFYDIPSFFNAMVTVINSILFFQILTLFEIDPVISLGGTISYSLLVNTNLYIRHLFPYDYSLLCFFMVLLLILRAVKNKQSSARVAVACGILGAMGFLIYPGYYADAFIMSIFFAVSLRSNLFKYALSFMGSIMFFELISKLAGVSYFKELFVWSSKQSIINHGGLSEGFFFIVRYLKEVEGLIGILLLVLSLLYLLYFIFRDRSSFKLLFMAAFFMYLLNVIMGIAFSQTVFYGRTIHMYFPFLVMAATMEISLIPKQTWRGPLVIILILSSFFSFVPFACTYSRLSYPGDVFFKYLSHVPLKKILWISADKRSAPDIDKNYSVVLLNFEPYDTFGYHPPDLSSNMVLAIAEPHPINFPGYAFERYSPIERKMIKKSRYQMQIYLNSHRGIKIDNEENDSEGVSLYKTFNPKLPFIYTHHWSSEYLGPTVK